MKIRTNNQLVSRFRLVAQALASFVCLIGISATLGWQFNVSILKRILPSLPVIAPNTAVAFIIVGISILVLSKKNRGKSIANYFLWALSAAILVLGMATLLEYIFQINLGVDRIFFARQMGASTVRMSPQSAFNFFSIGLAMFFFAFPGRKTIAIGQAIILLAGCVALTSLFGFIYNIADLYTIGPYKGMAAHTAVAFVLVFASLLLSHSEAGFMQIFVRRGLSAVAARRLFGALTIVFLFEILVMEGRRSNLYGATSESLIHLVVVAGVFVFLIFFSFRSLDQLTEAEQSLAHIRDIDRAKTEFVSLASHQLRTPLTSVSWFAEMLLKNEVGSLNTKQKEYLNEMYSGNRRMIDLVDDLLNASRIDMGVLVVEPKPMNLEKVIRSILTELDPVAKGKNIKVTANFSGDLASVELDPELTRIIFQNLISNSVKYTPTGGSVSV